MSLALIVALPFIAALFPGLTIRAGRTACAAVAAGFAAVALVLLLSLAPGVVQGGLVTRFPRRVAAVLALCERAEMAWAARHGYPDPFAAGDGADAHYLRLWAELVFKLRRRGLRPVCGSRDVDVQPLAARPRGDF